MKNDVLDAEKTMLMLAGWLEAERALFAAEGLFRKNQALYGYDLVTADERHNRARAAVRELDPARIRQLGSLLGQLHPLAVTASSSTGTASEVRAARDELVRVCLELGGEA